MPRDRRQRSATAGGAVAVYAGAIVMFALGFQMDGVLAYLVAIAGVLSFFGATLLLVSVYID
ncbi:uncharacterized protein Nmag_2059 [Natrialba magadii ATCC 43099]|uniref:Iron(III) ABC transporter permease n=1 Tax=Natrialba magadii (strain ATCC 43099 / DSM 3394 / CCM 3739 / CIP 104546 / IAM 13178 / JCM 8861 / NBRC 102185 / NCIMB 2190 / MS3) TaxID=547559 RepID=D3SVM1_NATMM|nr:uncharacterized protein Nmag_2059 [Natrialba magadii ATCC 43099]ELY29958.1 iron(III) ABC transporter permease [Natrialba magadii ATCC 43099]